MTWEFFREFFRFGPLYVTFYFNAVSHKYATVVHKMYFEISLLDT